MRRAPTLMVSTMLLLSQPVLAGTARADTVSDFPAVLVCEVSGRAVLAYLSSIESDGSARYIGLHDGAATVSPDGEIEAVSTMNKGDCHGRTIAELRESGRTLEFARP